MEINWGPCESSQLPATKHTKLYNVCTYQSLNNHTVGSVSSPDIATEDGLNDCGIALSFTSVNLTVANVIRLNSSMGSM